MSDNANVGKVINLTGGGGGGSSLTLESIAVTATPNKTTYKIGERFDPTGMVVAASYGHDVTANVTGWKVSPLVITAGLTAVTITYTENRVTKTATTPITVISCDYLYGYDINLSDSNPATRVTYPADVDNVGFDAAVMNFGGAFSYGGWPETPGEKFMPRPCMLTYAGTVGYYLNPDDYAKKSDGASSDIANTSYGGNAMMEWPKIYTKRWESGGVYHFRCSDVKIDDDYECWSNYDKNNNEISHFYTPIYFGSLDSSNRLRSLSGQTNMVSKTASNEITYAKANGENIWYTEVAADRFLINDLLTMMFKSTDLQTTLGSGVVNADAAINTGTMNDKGLFWGTDDWTDTGVKVFGMENWWGNLYRRIAGWMYVGGVQKLKLTRGTKDGTTATDYNTTGEGYLEIADSTISGNGYISEQLTQSFGRLPITAAGSSTTYEPDYVYRGTNASYQYYAFVGGSWGSGDYAGPFYVNLYYRASNAYAYIGAALSCKPLAAA